MAKCTFLAMTASEIQESAPLAGKPAWMACQFSTWNPGLSNLPPVLPEGSLLILNDQAPVCGHDAVLIAQQLAQSVKEYHCFGVLLDFERTGLEDSAAMAAALTAAIPCPVGVSAAYAGDLPCPVFLPPVPPDTPLPQYLAPWAGREIWLEAALNGSRITLTEQGATLLPLDAFDTPEQGFLEETLHCHYRITETDSGAVFTLWRTPEDLSALLDEAERLGIAVTVGLYQELCTFHPFPDSPVTESGSAPIDRPGL